MKISNCFKILVLGVGLLMSGCVQTKKISKGNVFYKFDMDNSGGNVLHKYTVERGFTGSLTDKGGYVTLTPDDNLVISNATNTAHVLHSTISIPGPVTGTDAQIQASGAYFFKETAFDTTPAKRNIFAYLDTKFMLQTLAIPLKIRPELTGPEYGNAFPQQVEAGFNFGFAFGWKLNKNVYRSTPNLLGLNTNRISVAPGLLLNFGSTALTDKNTRPAFTVERKSFTYSGGLVLLFGFNNVNFGICRGVDYVTGPGKGDWVYQGKPWTGIIVALDLLK